MMSDEQENKWREEAMRLFNDSYLFSENIAPISYLKGFLAAKTSSYELKENMRKRGNNLSKECVELQKEIQKRDELLEQAKPLLMTVRNHCSDYWTNDHIQWLKQYEELKK